ncbi:hypothetical protein T484DRAFT_1814256 [Baffinella frigidus]|nr:hypothetical protein T484DRAFT_1814256 [Cryptophyta sp. CCMP2293]
MAGSTLGPRWIRGAGTLLLGLSAIMGSCGWQHDPGRASLRSAAPPFRRPARALHWPLRGGGSDMGDMSDERGAGAGAGSRDGFGGAGRGLSPPRGRGDGFRAASGGGGGRGGGDARNPTRHDVLDVGDRCVELLSRLGGISDLAHLAARWRNAYPRDEVWERDQYSVPSGRNGSTV